MGTNENGEGTLVYSRKWRNENVFSVETGPGPFVLKRLLNLGRLETLSE